VTDKLTDKTDSEPVINVLDCNGIATTGEEIARYGKYQVKASSAGEERLTDIVNCYADRVASLKY